MTAGEVSDGPVAATEASEAAESTQESSTEPAADAGRGSTRITPAVPAEERDRGPSRHPGPAHALHPNRGLDARLG